ncbi:Na+/proline symporter [Hymenobacter luteus]|uniref:Na+/proline symporter n=2 Tax=Hymenobacter TaxID=89966 RepID=A0A7W9T122_9BACT|nr:MULTISPECIES: sodium:solute symporter [Hymenobacter]MBB4600770.1 Na+/proline symporter [Hymenobacter latericoloratus]MBB6059023.1 Na+/proline symporter [Hymenobacter luteus]
MSPTLVLSLIAGYFVVLIIIAYLTSRKATSESFFIANRNAPWYMVAFAMIGTSLSGVTFVSVPGQVLTGQWSYLGLVFGYVAGYAVIGTVLLPLYYRLNLVSIYTYLEQRFGFWSYKTGAFFFLLSRAIGAAFRLFLVAGVLQLLVFEKLGVPFAVTVTVSILLIYLYTFRGGLKTILWTDTFQTLAMLLCVVVSIGLIGQELNLGWTGLVQTVRESPLSETFFFDDPNSKKYFWKQFAAGMFITITMTGLDQDLMQKNLSCRSLQDAQKNMFWFTLTLVLVNVLFLSLGVLLYEYASVKGLALDKLPELLNPKGTLDTDKVFPYLATNHFSLFAGVVFVLGIIAVTYASADSALTALTTSFCVDFLNISRYPEARQKSMRQLTHLAFTVVLIVIILIFRALNDQNVVSAVFDAAGYTYGPLLGLYAFGLYTQRRPQDRWVPLVCVLSPVLTWVLVKNAGTWLNGYEIGFEKLIYNGLLTFIGLWAVSRRVPQPELNPVA